MDSITHIALGACMGEAFAGKKLGKKAMIWGVLAQSIPDIDFVASFWLDTSSNLLAHRGFTHSILFALIITPFLALLTERLHRPHDISFRKWMFFFGGLIGAHIFMDAFNNYGVGWFEPFNHTRISFNAIYVADPFFSIWSGIACLLLLLMRRHNKYRNGIWKAGLGISALYLGYCLINKIQIDRETKTALAKQNITYNRYFTTPAPLQNWLWYIVAENDKGYYVGFRSLCDHVDTIALQYFPRNDSLLKPVSDHVDLQQLIRFSKGFYTVGKYGDTLLFNDLRFGQIAGWDDPRGRFVFYYYLQHQADNTLVVQRGRFDGWNRRTIYSFWKRVQGEH